MFFSNLELIKIISIKLKLNIESKCNQEILYRNPIVYTEKADFKANIQKIRRNLIKATVKSLNLKSKLITNYSFPTAYRFREEESL